MTEVDVPTPEPEPFWDAPNQQVVRPDASAPWDEGDGGSTHPPTYDAATLDAMTKAELLDYARRVGASPANNDMTKEELRAAVDAVSGG